MTQTKYKAYLCRWKNIHFNKLNLFCLAVKITWARENEYLICVIQKNVMEIGNIKFQNCIVNIDLQNALSPLPRVPHSFSKDMRYWPFTAYLWKVNEETI